MKKYTIMFWVSTIAIFLFEGVMPALTSQTEFARQGILHLGYPVYFIMLLTTFKILGALALILPFVPKRIKEWAYAGFTFNFISACVSTWVVDGFGFPALFPIVVLAVLAISYFSFHKVHEVPVVN